MSEYVHKRHNVSVLIYHIVCPAKYRRVVFDKRVERVVRDICLEISKRYEVEFLEIGIDQNHVHFLVQSVPGYSPKKLVQTIKSITAREVFRQVPEVKKLLWGGEFWGKGYYISTVGKHGDETTLSSYVRKQSNDKTYKALHQQQLKLWG
jgi:REP element-mobilizing transposase RayT